MKMPKDFILVMLSVSQYCLHLSSSPLIHVLSMGQASHIYTLARLQFNLMRKHYFEKLHWYNDSRPLVPMESNGFVISPPF